MCNHDADPTRVQVFFASREGGETMNMTRETACVWKGGGYDEYIVQMSPGVITNVSRVQTD